MNVRKELQADRMKKKDSTLKKLEAHFRIIHPNATREDQKNRWLTASTNPSNCSGDVSLALMGQNKA